MFILLFTIWLILIVAFVLFKYNPVYSNGLYFYALNGLYFYALGIFIIVLYGYRRKSLGLSFMFKYSIWAKEFYVEFRRMFTE